MKTLYALYVLRIFPHPGNTIRHKWEEDHPTGNIEDKMFRVRRGRIGSSVFLMLAAVCNSVILYLWHEQIPATRQAQCILLCIVLWVLGIFSLVVNAKLEKELDDFAALLIAVRKHLDISWDQVGRRSDEVALRDLAREHLIRLALIVRRSEVSRVSLGDDPQSYRDRFKQVEADLVKAGLVGKDEREGIYQAAEQRRLENLQPQQT